MTTTHSQRFVLALDEALDAKDVGAKAFNLAKLRLAGHAVPPAFVVTSSALEAFLRESDLTSAIQTASSKLDSRSPLGIQCAAETIAALIQNAPLPAALADALGEIAAALGEPLIVRSSAVGEDSANASFAGQLDSIAHVRGTGLLQRALLDVWSSRWSARVLSYELSRGISLAGMGVIVQQQIESAVSGVLFTRLVPGDPQMFLEYCAGMGEGLVSGRENPGRIVISRSDFRWTQEATPDTAAGGEALLLNDGQIAALSRAALSIEQTFGSPQDIEWTIDGDGRLWILQARPVTAAKVTAGRVTTGADRVHWTNANVNENFPEPISPLLYSIASTGYYHYFRNLGRAFGIAPRRLRRMEQPLRHIIGVQGARMYYNLTSIHGVLRSAPFGELLTSSFNVFVGADSTNAPAADSHARSRWRTLAQASEVAAIAVKTFWQYAFLTRRVERFERRVAEFAGRTHPDALRGKSADALLNDFRAFLDIRNNRWNDAALADAASMVCYGVLRRLLMKALPGADQSALHNNLLKALPGLVSSIPAIKLWELSHLVKGNAQLQELFSATESKHIVDRIQHDSTFATFKRDFSDFLETWGFRCSGELMLTTASFQEEPEKLIDVIKVYIAMDSDSPAALLERQARERHEETRRVRGTLRRQPWGFGKSGVILLVLGWTQKAIQLRERARLKQALLYSRLRRIVLALGDRLVSCGRLEQPEDVFFLSAEELDSLVSGSAMFPNDVPALIAIRRKAHGDLSAVIPPDALTLGRGEYFSPSVSCASESPSTTAGNGDVLRGLGACGGTTTATAAVLSGLAESSRLCAGDVLVTRQTDPGWGPVFPLISALVIERGGMLSHGAIIAREFGIPSVVGVRDATSTIKHGSRVHVDGDLGIVRVLEPQRA